MCGKSGIFQSKIDSGMTSDHSDKIGVKGQASENDIKKIMNKGSCEEKCAEKSTKL